METRSELDPLSLIGTAIKEECLEDLPADSDIPLLPKPEVLELIDVHEQDLEKNEVTNIPHSPSAAKRVISPTEMVFVKMENFDDELGKEDNFEVTTKTSEVLKSSSEVIAELDQMLEMKNSHFLDIQESPNTSEPPNTTIGYKCANCSQEFKMESRFKRHKMLQVCVKHECDICHKVLRDKDGLSLHCKNVHNISYRCNICGENFLKKMNLVEHRKVHLGKVFYCCEICQKRFPSESKLYCHKQSVHLNVKRYTCDICEKAFAHKCDLINHKSSMHEDSKALTCEICNKSFTLKSTLVRHKNIVHFGLRLFKCDICGSSFDQEDRFLLHKKNVHFGVKPHVCIICNKSFARSLQLVEHHRVSHSDTKEFTCEICGKNYALMRCLKNHLRNVHRSVGALTCCECRKTFKNKRNLCQHMIIHSADEPYSCDVCGNTFGLKRGLVTHKRRFHSEDPRLQ